MTAGPKSASTGNDPVSAIQALLHGAEYDRNFPPQTAVELAKAAGVIIVAGASDDLMELYGAIRDEFGCYDGGTALLDAKGLLGHWESVCDRGDQDEIRQWFVREAKAKKIEAIWAPKEPEASWVYQTDIPHITFDVMEDGELYCRGLLIRLADLTA